jgi:hypothetical protein
VNIIGWLYGQFIGDTALVTALGGSDQIVRAYPNTIDTLPIMAFLEANNRDESFYENRPLGASEAVDIHVFTKFDTPTTTISDLISAKMSDLLFTRDYQADQDDPSTKVRHKVMKFSRDNIVQQDLA